MTWPRKTSTRRKRRIPNDSFTPVFKRNGQFSKVQPVPVLGDEGTSIESVARFYTFWYLRQARLGRDNFSTWRDFSMYDEYDLREAESRLEKRWMEKENKKIRDRHLKEERARLNRLVSLAKK
jgi:DnaJ family protein C protein 2